MMTVVIVEIGRPTCLIHGAVVFLLRNKKNLQGDRTQDAIMYSSISRLSNVQKKMYMMTVVIVEIGRPTCLIHGVVVFLLRNKDD